MDIEGISLTRVELLNNGNVFKSLVDFSHLERAPGKMLVDLVVALVSNDGCLILSHGLNIVLLLLIKHTDFDKSISFSLKCEGTGEDRILEIADGLLNLVCFSKYHTQFVKDFTLLVEVWRHL